MNRHARSFALVQIAYGLLLALGSCGELAVGLQPELLPPDALAEYERLHDSPLVRAWVLAQNLVVLPIALGFVVAGAGSWRPRAWAPLWTWRCAVAMLSLGVFNQCVLSIILYPELLAGKLGVADPEAWCLVLVFAGLAMLIWPAIALVVSIRRLCDG